jgi:hypothetical protein
MLYYHPLTLLQSLKAIFADNPENLFLLIVSSIIVEDNPFNTISLMSFFFIDSLFLQNAIAVAGSDFSKLKSIVPVEQAVIVFDNEPRNPEIVKHLSHMIEDGFTVCIWPKSIKKKDINDMVLNGLSSTIIEDTINKNKFSGLSAKMALSDWSKVSG